MYWSLWLFSKWHADGRLFEEGGDWERKNRLKVYEGLYFMSTRNFKQATDLFLDSISTFTTYEIFPYDTFIFYTVLTSIISLDRVSLKLKVGMVRYIIFIVSLLPSHYTSLERCLARAHMSVFNCSYIFTICVAGSWCSWDLDCDWENSTSVRIFKLSLWLSIQVIFLRIW